MCSARLTDTMIPYGSKASKGTGMARSDAVIGHNVGLFEKIIGLVLRITPFAEYLLLQQENRILS